MQIRGVEGDFLVLAYDGADRLYLPVSKLRQVQKFTGAAPDAIRLDRLGGTSFALRKARVKEQLLKMAGELLALYAARAANPGFKYAPPDETYREFEAEFPYEPTPDQAKAIEDVVARPRSEKRARGADGPARLRRRRLRQDRGRDARRDAGGAREEAGRGARADDGARRRSTSGPSASGSRATRSGSRRSRG